MEWVVFYTPGLGRTQLRELPGWPKPKNLGGLGRLKIRKSVKIKLKNMVDEVDRLLLKSQQETQDRQSAINAALNQFQINLNETQVKMMEATRLESANWAVADQRLNTKFEQVNTHIGEAFKQIKQQY